MTRKKPVEMVTCPWGCGEVPRDKYADHLMGHYKKKGKKLLGPFPARVKKED